MRITKLETKEQFEKVKKNSLLIVQWAKNSTAARQGESMTASKVFEVLKRPDEVVVRKKR